MFGADLMKDIKSKVREVWDKFTDDKTLVRRIIGEPAAHQRVQQFADQPGLEIRPWDGISHDLAGLEDKYQAVRKILAGLVSGVVLAAGIVGTLQVFGLWAAAPWVALAIGGAYAAIIGGALLVGLNYTGSRPLFAWTRGVCEIVQLPQNS
jgi:hypothetical protein